jgi:hypothetical protein
LGTEQFRQELLAQVNQIVAPGHFGPEVAESARAKAEKILGAELQNSTGLRRSYNGGVKVIQKKLELLLDYVEKQQ